MSFNSSLVSTKPSTLRRSQLHGASKFQHSVRNAHSAPKIVRSSRPVYVDSKAKESQDTEETSRRSIIAAMAAATCLSSATSPLPASAAGIPAGFAPVKDLQDGYQFLYPFGWQEVSVQGADCVYKDVIEPLESVSITMVDVSETSSITELGSPAEVAQSLINNALTSRSATPTILNASQRDVADRTYYTFEFTTKAKTYQRHAISTVAIGNGKLYTLTTGANEKRWKKMKNKLDIVARSFEVTFATEKMYGTGA